MRKSLHTRTFVVGALLATTVAPALAAEGTFLIGYGTRQKSLGGADTADSRDAMSQSVNPAGIAGMGRVWQFGGSLILPERGYSAYGQPHFVAPGDARSGRAVFPVPHSASVYPLDADSSIGMSSYANGGINTAYSIGYAKSPIVANGPGGLTALVSPSRGGVFGGGFSGIDLQQDFISVTYARKFGPVSIGVAPTFAVQMLNLQGLANYAPYSVNPGAVSDNGYDWSFGGGLRAGLEWRITDKLRFGAAGTTPMFMSAFSKYAGIIEGGGRLDIPASLRAGFAYDVTPDVTVMADWRHIFYSAVSAIGNSTGPVTVGTVGSVGGPGFGWRDTDSEGFGVEWRGAFMPALTLRAGYRHSSNPIPSEQITVNILGPAVSAHHLTGGFSYQITKNSSFDFGTVYAFKNSVSGFEALPAATANFGPFTVRQLPTYNSNAVVTGWLRGLEFSASWTYKFDPGDESWFPRHL
jgi:long-chain fatty acid transport protein